MNNNVPETARKEIKFIAYDHYYHSILYWLKTHSACFIAPYPGRRVNNIYFDTYGLNAYTENISGVSSRTKVRYRWYGNSEFPDAGILEVKQKRNCFGWKLQFKVDRAPYEAKTSWRTIRQLLLEQLSDLGKKWLKANPLPVLINRYFRRYFISGDGDIRVTVDSHQEAWEQRFKAYPNFSHRANFPHVIVVEFKFDRKVSDLASRFIQGIPIRQSRHSKYITGVKAISGN